MSYEFQALLCCLLWRWSIRLICWHLEDLLGPHPTINKWTRFQFRVLSCSPSGCSVSCFSGWLFISSHNEPYFMYFMPRMSELVHPYDKYISSSITLYRLIRFDPLSHPIADRKTFCSMLQSVWTRAIIILMQGSWIWKIDPEAENVSMRKYICS